MLGRIRSENDWQWVAHGKHPAARDFFSLDRGQPLQRALSEWAEKGYGILSKKGVVPGTARSWRFWARGVRKHMLVSGLVKDSCDLIGRPYPLFLMGAGTVKGWEAHWDLVPLACEGIWSQAEYVAARRHRDLEAFKEDLRLLKRPYAKWPELVKVRDESRQEGLIPEKKPSMAEVPEIEEKAGGLIERGHLLVTLEAQTFREQSALINLWHFHLKSRLGTIPNAVFIGGGPNQAYLSVFMRALAPADFVTLWSV